MATKEEIEKQKKKLLDVTIEQLREVERIQTENPDLLKKRRDDRKPDR